MLSSQRQFLNFLGIAQGAGKIISGENLLLNKVNLKRIQILVLASDAGSSADKKFHNKANYYQIPLNNCFTRVVLQHAVGRNTVVMGVSDPSFANRLIELNQEIKGQ